MLIQLSIVSHFESGIHLNCSLSVMKSPSFQCFMNVMVLKTKGTGSYLIPNSFIFKLQFSFLSPLHKYLFRLPIPQGFEVVYLGCMKYKLNVG